MKYISLDGKDVHTKGDVWVSNHTSMIVISCKKTSILFGEYGFHFSPSYSAENLIMIDNRCFRKAPKL